MDALATKIRTFGTIFAQQVKGLMIASIQALIPVIAGLVPAIMAVLNAVGVLGGGVLGLVGAFSVAGLGVVGFGAMAISALKMVEDGTLAVTKEVQNFRDASDQLKLHGVILLKRIKQVSLMRCQQVSEVLQVRCLN